METLQPRGTARNIFGEKAMSAHSQVTQAATKANETLEDYTLRFAPRSYRQWSCSAVAGSALGGIAYLADFAIGANIGISHGTLNALLGIAYASFVIFITGLPTCYYAARYNIDLDLITRGSGFGYYGSILTNVIFGSFTFIFFALEGSIMAQGLELGLGIPLWMGYALSTFLVLPLVIYGMKALAKFQAWTTPMWLVLMVLPMGYLVLANPDSIPTFLAYTGEGTGALNFGAALMAAGVCLPLMCQNAEQIDYLRFMPPRTDANRKAWWWSVILGGPGWVILGGLKQITGLFIAVYMIAKFGTSVMPVANEPVHQFLTVYQEIMPMWLAMTLAVVLVVVSQIKINVTNAYCGSLAWTNSYTRITKRYPGRLIFVVLNLIAAFMLMEMNMFAFLNSILGFYSNCTIAWVTTVAVDIAINKYVLKISPKTPEYRRSMLYDFNPVGFVTVIVTVGVSIAIFFGLFGKAIQPYSALTAFVIPIVMTPVMAIITQGKYYLRRADDGIDLPMFDADGNPSGETLFCHVCQQEYERPDMIAVLQENDAGTGGKQRSLYSCSLCLSTDKTGKLLLPAT